MSIQEVTQETFQSLVLDSELPVMVDFFGPTCAPCKGMMVFLPKVAEKYQGRLTILKCDVSANPTLAAEYEIRAVPTLIFFKNEPIQHLQGFKTQSQLEALIDLFLAEHLHWDPSLT